MNKIDQKFEKYLQDTLKKTSVSFIVSRGFNSLVSLIQGIDTGGSAKLLGTGVSGSISPGEILDPINDMVERFSWVMLVSSVSIGIQMFLMKVLPWLCVKYLLPIAFVLLIIVIWTNKSIESRLYRIALKTIIISMLFRFFIPTMAYTNDIIYNYSLKDKYKSSANYIEKQKTKLNENESVLDKIEKLKNKLS